MDRQFLVSCLMRTGAVPQDSTHTDMARNLITAPWLDISKLYYSSYYLTQVARELVSGLVSSARADEVVVCLDGPDYALAHTVAGILTSDIPIVRIQRKERVLQRAGDKGVVMYSEHDLSLDMRADGGEVVYRTERLIFDCPQLISKGTRVSLFMGAVTSVDQVQKIVQAIEHEKVGGTVDLVRCICNCSGTQDIGVEDFRSLLNVELVPELEPVS